MIRPGIRPIVVASMAAGIAAKGIEESELSESGARHYEALRRAAERLIEEWPTRIRSKAEMKDIGKHLDKFLQQTKWDQRPRNIQTYCHFVGYLFENIRESVNEPKRRRMIDAVLEATTALWREYAGREFEWCLQAGIRAAQAFEQIMAV